jgi:hypothetical protein
MYNGAYQVTQWIWAPNYSSGVSFGNSQGGLTGSTSNSGISQSAIITLTGSYAIYLAAVPTTAGGTMAIAPAANPAGGPGGVPQGTWITAFQIA